MNNSKPHRNLMAWQKSMDFAVHIYELTRRFPIGAVCFDFAAKTGSRFGPLKYRRRCSGRTQQQFSNYLSNAIGSLNEIDTQLELALRLGYVKGSEYDRSFQALDECLALTYGLRKSVSRNH